MSEGNLEQRVAQLEKQVDLLPNILSLCERERTDRMEMCLTIMQTVVDFKNTHIDWVKCLAEKQQLFDATERRELLDHVARVESVFERIEKIIRDGRDPGTEPPQV